LLATNYSMTTEFPKMTTAEIIADVDARLQRPERRLRLTKPADVRALAADVREEGIEADKNWVATS